MFVWFKYPDWKLPLHFASFHQKEKSGMHSVAWQMAVQGMLHVPDRNNLLEGDFTAPLCREMQMTLFRLSTAQTCWKIAVMFLRSSWSKGGNSCESLLVIHVWEFSNRESNIAHITHYTHTHIMYIYNMYIYIHMQMFWTYYLNNNDDPSFPAIPWCLITTSGIPASRTYPGTNPTSGSVFLTPRAA